MRDSDTVSGVPKVKHLRDMPTHDNRRCLGHPNPSLGSPVSLPHLGTARVPVPRCRGSQRRRMVVARPPLQGCVMSLDLPGDMGGQEDSGGTVWVSPPCHLPAPEEEDDVRQVRVAGGEELWGRHNAVQHGAGGDTCGERGVSPVPLGCVPVS